MSCQPHGNSIPCIDCEHKCTDFTVFFDVSYEATLAIDGALIVSESENDREIGSILCDECGEESTPSDFKSIR